MTRRTFDINNPGEQRGMVQEDRVQQNAVGRTSNEDARLREEGIKIRDIQRDAIWNAGLRRPLF